MTNRQHQMLIALITPPMSMGWTSFAESGEKIIAGRMHSLGLLDRREYEGRKEYKISDAGLAHLQWEIDTLADIERIGAIVGQG